VQTSRAGGLSPAERLSLEPVPAGFALATGLPKRPVAASRSEEPAQESPGSLEHSAEESADAREQPADGTRETAYHAHLSITCIRITRDRRQVDRNHALGHWPRYGRDPRAG
jgi:hypothetical protein